MSTQHSSRAAADEHSSRVFASVAVGLVGLVLVVAVVMMLAGAVSGLVSGRGWAWPSGGMVAVGRAVVGHPGDPAQAWPTANGSTCGPAAVFWVLALVLLLLLGTVGIKLWLMVDRWRHHRSLGERGLATSADLAAAHLSRDAAAARAQKTQPGLRDTKVRHVDPDEAAIYVGNLNGNGKDPVYVQQRDCTLVEGPTGAGKTWRLAVQRCWDAPGFLLVTTTKADLIAATVAHRRGLGEIAVFDPEQITGWPHPVKWSLLAGCEDPSIALRRASALVKAAPMGDVRNSSFWEERGTTLLRCYLMAARVSGKNLMMVRRWINTKDYKNPVAILHEHYPEWALDLEALATSGSDSSDDVYATAAKMLSPLADPAVAAIVDVPVEESINLEAFVLDGKNTLYLASQGDQDSVAPIVATMAAEVYRLLERHSQLQPDQRLLVPARLVLDEVNNVAPIPGLPGKMTDSGGRNITIWAFAHNRLQNIKRWGNEAGREFTINAPNRILLPGLGDEDELASVSKLFGHRWEQIGPRDTDRRQRPVLTVDEIREMDEDRALMIYRGTKAIIVQLPSVWDVKQATAAVRHSQQVFARIVSTGDVHAELVDVGSLR